MPWDNHQCHKTHCHTPTQFHNRHTESYRVLGGGASKHNLSTLDFQIQWQPLQDRKSVLDLAIHTFGHSLFLLAQFQTSPPSRASLLPQARLGTARLATPSSFILLATVSRSHSDLLLQRLQASATSPCLCFIFPRRSFPHLPKPGVRHGMLLPYESPALYETEGQVPCPESTDFQSSCFQHE